MKSRARDCRNNAERLRGLSLIGNKVRKQSRTNPRLQPSVDGVPFTWGRIAGGATLEKRSQ